MIYYSHVNEDNRPESAVAEKFGLDCTLSVSGSGERVICLLTDKMKKCIALDLNPEAELLLAFKLELLKALDVPTYLKFTGAEACEPSERIALFRSLKSKINPELYAYWEPRRKAIEQGILYTGHFERFLAKTRPLLRFFLGAGFKETFYKPLSACKKFPGLRWRILVWFFGQRWVYRLFGNRDIAFIASDADTTLIPDAFDKALKADTAYRSFFHHLVFNGHLRAMQPEDLPLSLRVEHLNQLKKRLETGLFRPEYFTGDLKALVEERQLYFDNCLYSVSDILSFETFEYLSELVNNLKKADKKNVHLVFRSFVRKRLDEKQLQNLRALVKNLNDCSSLDLTGNYQVYHLEI